ncbi:MAG TPA: energy transducer TonB [Pyrinomonadaceae bacterium]|nr:energy transducer TonB [Pyrinomonadaceae bacterium]
MLSLIFALITVFVGQDSMSPALMAQRVVEHSVGARQDPSQPGTDGWGVYPESYVRDHAITTTMPTFPADAIKRRATGVVQAKIAINDRGEVERIKFNPNAHPLLKQAVADAVAKWIFNLQPGVVIPGRMFLSRLTFKFSIKDGEPMVELYTPDPDAPDSERLGYSNSAKELRLWAVWEETKPTKN